MTLKRGDVVRRTVKAFWADLLPAMAVVVESPAVMRGRALDGLVRIFDPVEGWQSIVRADAWEPTGETREIEGVRDGGD